MRICKVWIVGCIVIAWSNTVSMGQSGKTAEAVISDIARLMSMGRPEDRLEASREIAQIGTVNSVIANRSFEEILRSLLKDNRDEVVDNALESIFNSEDLLCNLYKTHGADFLAMDAALSEVQCKFLGSMPSRELIDNGICAGMLRAHFHYYLDCLDDFHRFQRDYASFVWAVASSANPSVKISAIEAAKSIYSDEYSGLRAIVSYRLLTDTNEDVRRGAERILGGEGLLDEDFGRIPGAAHKLSYQYILVSLLNGVKVDGLSDEWRRISEDVQKAKSVLKNNYGIIDYSFSVDNISTYLKNVCGIEGS